MYNAATRNADDHCRALCRACQQYAFEHTLQDSEFAQDKISTHFTMLNVHNTVVLFFAVFVVLANANANGVNIRTGRNGETIVRQNSEKSWGIRSQNYQSKPYKIQLCSHRGK